MKLIAQQEAEKRQHQLYMEEQLRQQEEEVRAPICVLFSSSVLPCTHPHTIVWFTIMSSHVLSHVVSLP